MATRDPVVFVLDGLLGLLADTQSANIVVTAGTDQDVVEVAKTDRAVVLEDFSIQRGLRIESSWVFLSKDNTFLFYLGRDPELVVSSELLQLSLVIYCSYLRQFRVLMGPRPRRHLHCFVIAVGTEVVDGTVAVSGRVRVDRE